MTRKSGNSVIIFFVLISLLILPGFLHAQKQKIKVTAEGATVRVRPDVGSDVISSPAVGTVFEVEGKSEGWFEVRIKTELGVTIAGFIHEMYVEIEEAEAQPAAPREVPKEAVRKESEVQPTAAEPAGRFLLFSLRLGGLYRQIAGYDYDFSMTYYDEPLTIGDSVANSSGPGLNLELGLVFLKFLEVTAGFSTSSKTMQGTYSFGLPNEVIYNDIAFDEAPADPTWKMTSLDVGLNFHPLQRGSFRPYVGLGASFVAAKLDLLENMVYQETTYSDLTHEIKITEVQFVNKSVNKAGFYLRGGLNLKMFWKMFLFFEGKYLVCKTDLPHPLTSEVSGYEDEKITVDLGGVSGLFGFRLLL